MADISSITLPNNSGTYTFKDKQAIRKTDELLTTNPFAPDSKLGPYISKIDNAFYAANARWNISASNGGSVSTLFDGDYESQFTIAAGTTAVITMDFSTETNGFFPGYPYGYILVSFYYSDAPASVSGRVYCNYQTQGVGWHDISFSPLSDNNANHVIYRSVHQSYYNLSQIEISVTAQSASVAKVTQIEMHLDRPNSKRTPFVSKYGAEKLYYSLTAPSFIGNLTGNASTATKATQDESGNNIKASYASSLSISDHTIILKNKNGTSLGTVTVPDTNTHRPIKVNSTQILGDNTTALNLAAGSNMSITSDANGNVTFAASGSAMPFMIVRQPVPVGISTDNTVVTFSIVLGGGSGSYTYQWQVMSGGTDWIDLGGSQGSSIDVLGHLVTDTIHRCVVSDGVTTLYSNPVYYYGTNSGTTGVKQSINDGNYGVCSTAAGTAAKTVSIPGLIVQPGVTIHVKFTNTNSASNPTLAVNSTPAKSIVLYGTTAIGTTAETTGWNAGAVVALTYDGTYWIRDQGYNTNTTYSNATTSSAGLMSAADKTAVNALKNLSTLEYEIVS